MPSMREQQARIEEQPFGAEHQQEAEMPPAIAPAAQMGWPRPSVG